MPKMIALTYHTYADKTYHEGDTYDADDEFVDTLEVMNVARRAPPDVPPAGTPLVGGVPAAPVVTPVVEPPKPDTPPKPAPTRKR